MKIVQIKGGNGSGKTTIIKQMLAMNGTEEDDLNRMLWVTSRVSGELKCYATLLRNVGWIVVGEYRLDKAMGGTDCYPTTVHDIKSALHSAVEAAWDGDFGVDIFGIAFEGMMISTIKSTFYYYLLDLAKEYGEWLEPLFVILETTPHGCLGRIQKRGTSRSGGPKFENIAGKSIIVVRHALTYDQKYVRWLDVESTPEAQMLGRFLHLVGDSELYCTWHSIMLGEALQQNDNA